MKCMAAPGMPKRSSSSIFIVEPQTTTKHDLSSLFTCCYLHLAIANGFMGGKLIYCVKAIPLKVKRK
jgi:hypothetical protein